MKLKLLGLCLVLSLMLIGAACAPAEQPAPEPAPAAVPDPPAPSSSDPLSGNWSGDWGPSPSDRNVVTIELKWDGAALTGVVNPGPNAVALTKATYDPATGAVAMEADAPGRGGATIHYVIEGKVEGNMMTGSWGHDDRKGDFKITKS